MENKIKNDHLMQFAQTLYSILCFNIFSIEELRAIVSNERLIKWKMFKRGKSVFKQGAFDQHFYIVIRGKVEICKTIRGMESAVGTVPAGGIFGENVICASSEPRDFSAYASGDEGLFLCEFDGTIVQSVHEQLQVKFFKKFIDASLGRHKQDKKKFPYYETIIDFVKNSCSDVDNEFFPYTLKTAVDDKNRLTQYIKYTDFLISQKIDGQKALPFLNKMLQTITKIVEL